MTPNKVHSFQTFPDLDIPQNKTPISFRHQFDRAWVSLSVL